MRILRFLVLFGALALGACENLVRSDGPLLTRADAAPEWTLKTGLWTPVDIGVCAFNPVRSVRNWPDCAEVQLVEKPGLYDLMEVRGGEQKFVMAQVDPDLFVVQSEPEDPEAWTEYLFLTRGGLDRSGNATRVGFGFVECGPAPPAEARTLEGARRNLALQLYPGVVADGKNCIAQGRDGLFAATRANAAAKSQAAMRWRRAARPDEITYLKRRQAREEAAAKRAAEAQSTIAE